MDASKFGIARDEAGIVDKAAVVFAPLPMEDGAGEHIVIVAGKLVVAVEQAATYHVLEQERTLSVLHGVLHSPTVGAVRLTEEIVGGDGDKGCAKESRALAEIVGIGIFLAYVVIHLGHTANVTSHLSEVGEFGGEGAFHIVGDHDDSIPVEAVNMELH